MTDHRHAGRGMAAAFPFPEQITWRGEEQTGPRVTIAKKGARRHLPEAGYRSRLPDRKTNTNSGQVPRRFTYLNLEPHIHLSKSALRFERW